MADNTKKKLPAGNSMKEQEKAVVTEHKAVVPEKKADRSVAKKVEEFANPIVDDVIIPGAQNMLIDIVENIADTVVNSIISAITGQPSNTHVSVPIRNGKRTDYNARSRNTRNTRNVQDNRTRISETLYIDDIRVNSRADAVSVIDQMQQLMAEFHRVTCNDFYGFPEIDKTVPFTYTNYGWTDIDGAGIIDNRDGTWGFDLPKPKPLNR